MRIAPTLIDLLATGFYSGKAPFSPGTIGTVAAAVLLWGTHLVAPQLLYHNLSIPLFIIIPTIVSVIVSEAALRMNLYGAGKEDPQQIVIDEFAGLYVAVGISLANGFSAMSLLLCFLFFRLFDIFKPFPISLLEKLPGGWGITMDDIGAGAIAGIIVLVIQS